MHNSVCLFSLIEGFSSPPLCVCDMAAEVRDKQTLLSVDF